MNNALIGKEDVVLCEQLPPTLIRLVFFGELGKPNNLGNLGLQIIWESLVLYEVLVCRGIPSGRVGGNKADLGLRRGVEWVRYGHLAGFERMRSCDMLLRGNHKPERYIKFAVLIVLIFVCEKADFVNLLVVLKFL